MIIIRKQESGANANGTHSGWRLEKVLGRLEKLLVCYKNFSVKRDKIPMCENMQG
jgi:hypothetical protein